MTKFKMTKTDLAVINAIRDNGAADCVYVGRTVGRVWMAGRVWLNERATSKMLNAGVIKHQRTAAAPLYGVLVLA